MDRLRLDCSSTRFLLFLVLLPLLTLFSPAAVSSLVSFSPSVSLFVAAESRADASAEPSSPEAGQAANSISATSEADKKTDDSAEEDKTKRTEEELKEKAREAANAAADAAAKALELRVPLPSLVTATAGAAAAQTTDQKDAGVATQAGTSKVVRPDDLRYQNTPENPKDGDTAKKEEETPIPVDGGECIIFAAEEGDKDSCSCPKGFVLCNVQDVQAVRTRLAKIEQAARAAAVRELLLRLDKLPAEELQKAPASSAKGSETGDEASGAPTAKTSGGELRGSANASGDQAAEGTGGTDEEERREAMLPPELAEYAKKAAKTAMSLHVPAWVKTLCDEDEKTGFKSYGVQIDYEAEATCTDSGTKDEPAVDFLYDLNTYVPLDRLHKLQKKDSSWTPRHCLVADFYLCKRLPAGREKVHCEISDWSEWSTECLDNTQTRKKIITRSGQHGGRACVWDGKQPVHAEVTEVRSCSES